MPENAKPKWHAGIIHLLVLVPVACFKASIGRLTLGTLQVVVISISQLKIDVTFYKKFPYIVFLNHQGLPPVDMRVPSTQ
jgi:hypothetical protein